MRLAVAIVALAACAPVGELALDAPEELTRLGVVRVDGGGSLGHGLVAPGARTWALEGGAHRVFGYTAAELAAGRFPEGAELEETPVLASAGALCGTLPVPAWSRAVDAEAEAIALPPLVADWSRRCPVATVAERSTLDVRCGPDRLLCGFERVDVGACGLELDEEACEELPRRFVLERDGRACGPERPADCAPEPLPDGGTRWRCPFDCTLDFHPPTPPVALAVDAVELGPASGGTGPGVNGKRIVRLDLAAGSLDALALRDGVAAAVVRAEANTFIGHCDASNATARELVRVDAESLAILGRSALGDRCVTRLVADPIGDGYLAGFHVIGSTSTFELGLARLGATGEVLLERRYARPLPAFARPPAVIPAILTSSATVLLVESMENGIEEGTTVVFTLDLATLEPRRPPTVLEGGAIGATMLGRNLLVTGGPASAVLIDPAGSPIEPVLDAGDDSLGAPIAIGPSEIVAADAGLVPSLLFASFAERLPRVLRRVRVYERPSIPMMLSPSRRGGPGVLSLLVARGDRYFAGLALYDPEERSVLPGLVELDAGDGRWLGPLLDLQRDAQDRVWAIAPWLGRVVRITVP